MEQRPENIITVAVIVLVDDFLIKEHRDAPLFFFFQKKKGTLDLQKGITV